MLKITAENQASTTILHLEGKLSGPWVNELERCWREMPSSRNLKIRLETVTFIDEHGKKLLAKLHASGAQLEASGCMTRCIVQEITSESHNLSHRSG
jgi:hypothetical protein